ncbi:hypothetical protein VTK73DRAFT_1094 [Phialemonium thermophilum]|uniref:Uncharacterized protein n=1 Tax=Phialemonium thermophilum TaxID=223376 RepID=A0ABR3VTW0_9PEZI
MRCLGLPSAVAALLTLFVDTQVAGLRIATSLQWIEHTPQEWAIKNYYKGDSAATLVSGGVQNLAGGGGGNMLAAGDGMTMPFFSPLQTQQPVQKENNMLAAGPSSSSSSMAAAAAAGMQAPARRPVNPLLVQADFSHPNHPYQQWYEPPNRTHSLDHP